MNQSAAAQAYPYQPAHYNAAAPPHTMYSGQQLQPPYGGQPLQPPQMASAAAPPAAWGYPPQAGYDAANGCRAATQAYGEPVAGAYLQSSAPGYAPAFNPAQAYYPPSQQSVNVGVSTAPSVSVVCQPTPVIMMLGVVKSYLAWSLVSLILFCLPLGIPALIYSLQVKGATTHGDKIKYSLMARNFNIAATVVGPVLILIFATSFGTRYTYYGSYYHYYYYYG